VQKSAIDGISSWSVWQPERGVFFNAHFISGSGQERVSGGESASGLLVDPLALSAGDAAEIERSGGVCWIVVTNRDHEREAAAAAERFGAKIAASAPEAELLHVKVDRTLADGDLICGARVIALDGMKSPQEIALAWDAKRTVLVGDAIWGAPAGSLSLPPNVGDPAAAVLSVRKLRARRPRHLLVGDGASVYFRAYEAINDLLEQRTEALTSRINIDEIAYGPVDPAEPAGFRSRCGEIGYLIGASVMGYQAALLPPGQAVCPQHWHTVDEELLLIWQGAPLLYTPAGETRLRRGDMVHFPVGERGAHRLHNDTDQECIVLLLASNEGADVCFYPDSKKLLVSPQGIMVRSEPELQYFDGEGL
jgi:uncharacterized cupin superfamily protein